MQIKLRWKNDTAAEMQMASMGVKPRIAEVLIKNIDLEASLKNNARIDCVLNNERVTDYANGMLNGDVFERLVCLHLGGNKFIILGGNHRVHSAKSIGAESVEAYVLEDVDEQVRVMLPRMLNRTHGIAQDRKEAIQSAILGMERFGWSTKQAAERMVLTADSITRVKRIQDSAASLKAAGIPGVEKLRETTIEGLASIKFVNVRHAAARNIIDCGADVEQAKDLIRRINKSTACESDQHVEVADWKAKMGGGQKELLQHRRPKRTQFLGCLTRWEGLLEKAKSISSFQITDKNEQADTRKRIAEVCKKLAKL